jgi:hypothetical protein
MESLRRRKVPRRSTTRLEMSEDGEFAEKASPADDESNEPVETIELD